MTSGDKHPLQVTAVCWAFLSVTFALGPHIPRFSAWLILAFFSMGLWRVLGAFGKVALPERRYLSIWLAKQCVAVAIFVATYISFDGQLGRDAGVAMLTALLGLKLLEMHTTRDFYIVMFLAYFLVVTNLFYSQTLFTAVFMVGVVVTVTAGLIHFNAYVANLSKRQCFKLSFLYCAQALPIMIVAFVVFPRIPGPLWGVSQNGVDGVTGLSDEMTIGNVARLGVSDEIAFRVQFKGAPPAAKDLYWRGPVFWETDGISWRPGSNTVGKQPTSTITPPLDASPTSYAYQVIIEPHGERWIFALDHASWAEQSVWITTDGQVVSGKKIGQRKRFDLVSDTNMNRESLDSAARAAALFLPEAYHPQAKLMAKKWLNESNSQIAVIDKALRFFNEQDFIYSLTPKPLSADSIDSFLFETREGFCEYYASAFVVLMRAAGIPARVVTGYQGGENNALSDFMLIRQRDAHAWAEVYFADRGWVRMDPTSAVAPERLSLGLTQIFPSRRPLSMLDPDNPVAFTWNRVRDIWEAVNFNWSRWVLGYTPQQQRQFLDKLGLLNWHYGALIIVFTLSTAALLFLFGFFVLNKPKLYADRSAKLYAEFCRKLAKAGLTRAPHEGPFDFANRVAATNEGYAEEVDEITSLYVELRYASRNNDL
ncbi:MAG: DUF3488 and transglutaminase-like domain-containing protein, partial [Pseudomonadota bacterium]